MSDFNQTKYINDFIKEKYDTIKVQVPKGQKTAIEEYRKAKGYRSLNAYINDLIKKDMKNSNECSNQGGGDCDIENAKSTTRKTGLRRDPREQKIYHFKKMRNLWPCPAGAYAHGIGHG